jgi:hypothetical protein
MSDSTASIQAPEPQSPLRTRRVLRAVSFGVAWLPSLALLLFLVSKFHDLHDRLAEKGELPLITEWMTSYGRANLALFGLPFLILFGLLLFVDASIFRLCVRSGQFSWLYWVWFTSVIVVGLLAVLFVLAHARPQGSAAV